MKGDAEAAVCAARPYLQDLDSSEAVLKLDFQNAFNTIHRDWMLNAVREHAPTIYPFVHSVYSAPSSLFWSDRTIQSGEGMQQGDPLGPLLFCLSIQHIVTQKESELWWYVLFYLDDGTLGGSVGSLRHDLEVVEQKSAEIGHGLQLNRGKSEIICANPNTLDPIAHCLPGAPLVHPSKATLLGSLIGDEPSVSEALTTKLNQLKRMVERLHLFSSHDAILLLRHSFSLPKLLYNKDGTHFPFPTSAGL